MRFHSIAGLLLIGSAAALVGCGDDGSGSGGAGSTASSTTQASTTSTTSTGGPAPTTCTENGTFCAQFVLPADVTEKPNSLIVGFYAMLPATSPPDAIGVTQPNPEVTPGEPYAIIATDITLTGTYRMLAAMYMPGGGRFQPVEGIDYDVASDPIEFTGAPINAGEFELKLHAAGDGHTDP